MKFILSLLTAFSFCLYNLASAQTTVGDVTLKNNYKFGDYNLVLNGGGIRKKLWFEVYVAGLYLKSKSPKADKIITSDELMAITIDITSSVVSSDKMISATQEGFEKSLDGSTQKLQDKIDQFIAVFNEEISVGDNYEIVYYPGEGVKVYKNKKYKSIITGLEFKQALFGIWLSDDPVDSKLKSNMLGI